MTRVGGIPPQKGCWKLDAVGMREKTQQRTANQQYRLAAITNKIWGGGREGGGGGGGGRRESLSEKPPKLNS
jgi:hypothetical protein